MKKSSTTTYSTIKTVDNYNCNLPDICSFVGPKYRTSYDNKYYNATSVDEKLKLINEPITVTQSL